MFQNRFALRLISATRYGRDRISAKERLDLEIYKEPERREFERIDKPLIISYHVRGEQRADVSQVKNISLGGLLFTTDRPFAPETILVLKMCSPLDLGWVDAIGRVIESKEIKKDLVYETRLSFTDISQETQKMITELVKFFTESKEKKKI